MITAIATLICTEGFGTYNPTTNTNNNRNQNQNGCQGANNNALGAAIGGVLRLSFHDSATYSDTDGSSGPDGCILFDNSDNGGLKPVVYSKANPATLYTLNDLYTVFSTYSSKADFWAVAANVAVMLGGGPDIAQRTGASCTTSPCVSMKWGRIDAVSCPNEKGRFPISKLAHQHILDVFQTRLGFSDIEIVALIGAHTVGRTHLNQSYTSVSGADTTTGRYNVHRGRPDRGDRTPHVFDNAFFQAITQNLWEVTDVDVVEDEDGDEEEMSSPAHFQWQDHHQTQLMLNTDLALMWDVSTVTVTSLSTTQNPSPMVCTKHLGGPHATLFKQGCSQNTMFAQQNTKFAPFVFDFAANQTSFYNTWTTAWTKMQELGWSNGKKGTLYPITSTACV